MISIRRATSEDASTVHSLIRGLAEHQDQGRAVTVTVAGLPRDNSSDMTKAPPP